MKKINILSKIFLTCFLFFTCLVPVSASTTVTTTAGYSYTLYSGHTKVVVPDSEIIVKLGQSSTESNRIKFAEAVNLIKSTESKIKLNTDISNAIQFIGLVLALGLPPAGVTLVLAGQGYGVTVQNLGYDLVKYTNDAELYFNAMYPYREIAPNPTCQFNGSVWYCPYSLPVVYE